MKNAKNTVAVANVVCLLVVEVISRAMVTAAK